MGFLDRFRKSNKRSIDNSDYNRDIFSASPTVSGENVTEQNALNFTGVYAAVRVISETIASLPLITYHNNDKLFT